MQKTKLNKGKKRFNKYILEEKKSKIMLNI
jgi:hypothetical protein